jgi:hypothetical protein
LFVMLSTRKLPTLPVKSRIGKQCVHPLVTVNYFAKKVLFVILQLHLGSLDREDCLLLENCQKGLLPGIELVLNTL